MRAQTTNGPGNDVEFDVSAFTRSARGSMRDEFDLSTVETSSDSAGLLRTLAVLEGATMAHLRNVLVTATHKDARVTAFLVTWAFEKFWIADALSAVAGNASSTASVGESASISAEPPGGSLPSGPVRRSLGGFVAGTSIVAVHTTAGLIDDLVLDAAYDAVSVDAPRSLAELLTALRETKARHTEFFAAESRRRLAGDARAVRLAARGIRRGAWPIGAPLLDDATRAAFTVAAFSGDDGALRAAAVGDAVAALPGIPPAVASGLADSLRKGA